MNRPNVLEALSDNIKIDPEKCIQCGKCVDTCILDNLRMKLAPCRQACPLGVNAQGYIQLIARGEEDKAREVVRETLPFPEIISRICDAPCERNCHRNAVTGQPVSIRSLKRYLFENDQKEQSVIPKKADPSGKRIAIVGSGPAGMLAAFDLAIAGHGVTVFESDPKPGGLLHRVIPAFRLPEAVLDREMDVLSILGVDVQCGIRVGQDRAIDDLENSFDAVILSTGLGGQLRLDVPGEDSKGVMQGLDFLEAAKHGNAEKLSGNIVVIGGGNAAVDTARVARRLGAEKVTIISLEMRDDLPASEEELNRALDDGVALECGMGVDRILEKSGKVSGVTLKRCLTVFDQNGCFLPSFDYDDIMTIPADRVIVSIGQSQDTLEGIFPDKLPIDSLTLQTARQKIFVAGDCFYGPTSVIHAMGSGRQAAVSVDRFLKGEHLKFNRAYAGPIVTDFEIDTSRGSDDDRVKPQLRPFKEPGDFNEIEQPYSIDEARKEARRCYSCGGPFGQHRTCWFCLPCEVECPEEALWVEVPYLLR